MARAGAADLTKRDLAQLSAATKAELAKLSATEKRSLTEYVEQGRNERFARSEGGREQRFQQADTTRRDIATENRTSREENQTLNREQRGDQFQQREHRLEQALDLRSDATWERLEQQKQAAMERAEQNKWKQGVAEVKTLIDEQDKHIRTKIAASNILSATQRKKMLEEADKVNAEQLTAMRTRAKGGSSAPAGQTDQPPAEALKEGQVTTFENGQKWTLKGGKPERVP